MPQVMESKAVSVLHELSPRHQQEIGEETAWEDEGVEAAFTSWLETPAGGDRDWEPSPWLVQLLQQVRQDRICQGYEPPEHGACLLGTQEIQALPSQAHCQGSHLAARDSEQRPQSILSLAERSDTKIMSMYKEPECEEPCEGRLSRTVLWEGEGETPSLYSTSDPIISQQNC